jgi:hypothetical protein
MTTSIRKIHRRAATSGCGSSGGGGLGGFEDGRQGTDGDSDAGSCSTRSVDSGRASNGHKMVVDTIQEILCICVAEGNSECKKRLVWVVKLVAEAEVEVIRFGLVDHFCLGRLPLCLRL